MFTKDTDFLLNIFDRNIKVKKSKEFKFFYDLFHNLQLYDYSFIEQNDNKKMDINSSFISEDIKKSFHLLNENKNFEFKLNDCLIKINLYYPSQLNIQKLLKLICIYLQFILSLTYDFMKDKEFQINYFLTNHKKLLDIDYQIPHIIDINEINSGSCSFGIIKEINIWRIEDILKTTLHEFIHALELDHFKDSEKIIRFYQKRYKISDEKINTNEAYTEFLANLFNCFLISKINHKNYDYFLKLIHLEKKFADYQSQKIFHLTKLSKQKKNKINKNTNVLSYFIIRNELYQKMNIFLKFCRLNNGNLFIINPDLWFNYLKKTKKSKKKSFRKRNQKLLHIMKFNLLELNTNTS